MSEGETGHDVKAAGEPIGGAAANMGMRSRAGSFGKALLAAAATRPEIVGLSADLKKYTDMTAFAEVYPDRYVEVGMAEQNLVMVAAGLAHVGLVPVATTFAAFLTRRAHDFTIMQVALPKANVKLIGSVPGILSSFGPSHTSIDDLAIMRAAPNLVVIDPSSSIEAGEALAAALDHDGPVYLRQPFDRGDADEVPGRPPFRLGQIAMLRDGHDVAIVALGAMVKHALCAADLLAERGISAAVTATPTLKPFDAEAVAALAERVRVVVTVENHSVVGGLFSTVAEALVRHGVCRRVEPVGVRDVFSPFGSFDYLVQVLGMDAPAIADAAVRTLEKSSSKRR